MSSAETRSSSPCCTKASSADARVLSLLSKTSAAHSSHNNVAVHAHSHDGVSSPSAPVSLGTIYTCPMHPQIRRAAPGNCPICGMALEPLSPVSEGTASPELRDMTRRFWIGTALTVPMVLWEMASHLPAVALHHYVSASPVIWLEFALSTPVVLGRGGRSLFARGPLSAIAR